MAKFRVTIAKVVGSTIKNPFARIHISLDDKTTMQCRSWEFEAKDEAQVRKYFEQAQRDGLENVRGFRLDKIERLDESEPK